MVYFSYADRQLSLKGKTEIKQSISALFKKEKKKLKEVRYIFCSDDYLLSINRSFLSHDFYTDIITFDLSDSSREVIAEIYISLDRVRENAKLHKTVFKQELLRVIFHGALHLCGYKDKIKSELTIMRNKEDQYLRLFG
ncbi:MAG: ybeY [Chitinophagaceae bacterium]|nr:ybeY [Chitinophagaceae bacterium]